MTTVMENMQFSSAEPEGEDGLTSLPRRVLYKLVVQGEVTARHGDLQGFDLATGLKLNPAVGTELVAAIEQLVELGMVTRSQRVVGQHATNAYGKGRWRDVVAADPDGNAVYRPVVDADTRLFIPSIAVGRPVLAWLYIYGSLEYVENLTEDGETCHRSRINEPMGEPESEATALRADAEALKHEWLVSYFSERRPGRWGGAHGQMHELIETHVILELNK